MSSTLQCLAAHPRLPCLTSMQMRVSEVTRSIRGSIPEHRTDEGRSHGKYENSDAKRWAQTAQEQCSGHLRKQDNTRTMSDSGPRRAWTPRGESARAAADPDAAAGKLLFKRVLSAISAPFGLRTSDSCSPRGQPMVRGTSTPHLAWVAEHRRETSEVNSCCWVHPCSHARNTTVT